MQKIIRHAALGALALAVTALPFHATAQSEVCDASGAADWVARVGTSVDAASTSANAIAGDDEDGWSWGRFAWGLAKGAATGLVVGAAAAVVIATAPAWVTVGLGVAAVGAAGYGIYATASNWDEMSSGDKSELAGEVVGGIFTGGLSARAGSAIVNTARTGTRFGFLRPRAPPPTTTAAADELLAARNITTDVAERSFQAGQEGGEILVHLTDEAGAAAINETGSLMGRWGIFTLEASKVPSSTAGKYGVTLVSPYDTPGLLRAVGIAAEQRGVQLTHGVIIPSRTAHLFAKPPRFGPFSLARRAAGVRNSPAGTLLADGTFRPGVLWQPNLGTFRTMTAQEIARAQQHQLLLDYGIDSLIYTAGGFYAYGQLREQ